MRQVYRLLGLVKRYGPAPVDTACARALDLDVVSVTKIAAPGYTAYAATKGAVDAMTLILAKEMRGRDVTVNAVAPGPTATPLFLDGKPQEVIDHLKSMPPLERLCEPADIAEAVAFLAGPARWVNGQVIYTNGGVV